MRVSNTLQKPAVRTLKIRDEDEEYFSLQRDVFQLAVLKSTPHNVLHLDIKKSVFLSGYS